MEKKGKEGGSRRPRLSDKRIDLWPSLPTALLEKLPDARQAEPAVQVVEPVTWLAGLESAGGGKVTIQWAMLLAEPESSISLPKMAPSMNSGKKRSR